MLQTSNRINITVIGLKTTLAIHNVQVSDFGQYRRIVRNGIGSPLTVSLYLVEQSESLYLTNKIKIRPSSPSTNMNKKHNSLFISLSV